MENSAIQEQFNLSKFTVNKMTQEQYDALESKDPSQIYIVEETPASTEHFGPVKVDGTTIVSNAGVISATPPAVEWGEIEGALSRQSDLAGALDKKADKLTTYTKDDADDLLDLKADKADTYTKEEVDQAFEADYAAQIVDWRE